MPTLRLVYLTEQQYAGMMNHDHAGAAHNKTTEEQLPSINQEQTRLVPIADATRNASSNKQSDHEDEDNDYLIDGVNRGISIGWTYFTK